MRTPVLALAVASLTTLTGCFAHPDGASAIADGPPPHALAVHDVRGAAFAPASAPRDPVLTLTFAERAPELGSRGDASLLLARGVFTPTFVARLGTARLSSALGSRAVPIARTETSGDALSVYPAEALAPGDRYTLLWIAHEPASAFPLAIGTDRGLGAVLRATLPAEGAQRVPPNLARAWLVLDGRVEGDLAAYVTLRDAADRALDAHVEAVPCGTLGLGDGSCASLVPLGPLAPDADHTLALSPGLVAPTGAPVAGVRISFHSDGGDDREPPQLVGTPCAVDEQPLAGLCALADRYGIALHGSVSEPVLATLALAPGDRAATIVSALSAGGTLDLPRIALDGPTPALLRLRDLAGQESEVALVLAPDPELPALAIDELRADPAGKEPAQEYVELLNSGELPVALMGYTLSTSASDKGRPLRAPGTLAPGERALVVAPEFDPDDRDDAAIPAGVRLIRLERALALANRGTTVFLRDARGRRVSMAATSLPALVPGQCTARDDHAAFALDPDGGCTPGRPTAFGP